MWLRQQGQVLARPSYVKESTFPLYSLPQANRVNHDLHHTEIEAGVAPLLRKINKKPG
jgi:hypothetical protein